MTGAAIIEMLGGVRATVFAGIAAALLVAVGVQTWRVGGKSDKIQLLEAQAVNWAQANKDNVKAIHNLRMANAAWAGLAESRRKRADDAVAAADAERDRLSAELNERRRDRGIIYERNPDAAVWGRGRVPPAVADQLRRGARQN